MPVGRGEVGAEGVDGVLEDQEFRKTRGGPGLLAGSY